MERIRQLLSPSAKKKNAAGGAWAFINEPAGGGGGSGWEEGVGGLVGGGGASGCTPSPTPSPSSDRPRGGAGGGSPRPPPSGALPPSPSTSSPGGSRTPRSRRRAGGGTPSPTTRGGGGGGGAYRSPARRLEFAAHPFTSFGSLGGGSSATSGSSLLGGGGGGGGGGSSASSASSAAPPMDVSFPTGVTHTSSVKSGGAGGGLTGLDSVPAHVRAALTNAGVSPRDVARDPAAAVAAYNLGTHGLPLLPVPTRSPGAERIAARAREREQRAAAAAAVGAAGAPRDTPGGAGGGGSEAQTAQTTAAAARERAARVLRADRDAAVAAVEARRRAEERRARAAAAVAAGTSGGEGGGYPLLSSSPSAVAASGGGDGGHPGVGGSVPPPPLPALRLPTLPAKPAELRSPAVAAAEATLFGEPVVDGSDVGGDGGGVEEDAENRPPPGTVRGASGGGINGCHSGGGGSPTGGVGAKAGGGGGAAKAATTVPTDDDAVAVAAAATAAAVAAATPRGSIAPVDPVYVDADPRDVFEDLREVGSGACGKVYLARVRATPRGGARRRAANGRRVALKKVSPSSPAERRLVEMEIRMMATTRHPNLIKAHETYRHAGALWITMEYMNGGCLTHVLEFFQKRRLLLEEPHIAYVLREVLRGLSHMHGLRRLHRDLKSDNILIDTAGGVRLADFGFCAQLTDERDVRHSVVGTPFYTLSFPAERPPVGRATAFVLTRTYRVEYAYSADIWSVGIVALESAEWEPPHFQHEPMKAMNLVSTRPAPTLKHPSRWSSTFAHFLSCCLSLVPSERWSAEELLGHPFIALSCTKEEMGPIFRYRLTEEAKQ